MKNHFRQTRSLPSHWNSLKSRWLQQAASTISLSDFLSAGKILWKKMINNGSEKIFF
jgi:hypothetical protein